MIQMAFRVANVRRRVSTAIPIGRSKVRTRVDSPPPLARTTNSLLAWYVLTSSDSRSSCKRGAKLSVWVYWNSTAAGVAGGGASGSLRSAEQRADIPILLWRARVKMRGLGGDRRALVPRLAGARQVL